ncbi:unnamed protein product [Pneumocystis jirovecii]|uniref:MICOS complex subunit MIC19 n=2 Tax=Pneumocystis jirovecii TaxID=42068 RepID=L0PE84_PNEJI|nr:uncharacterized protein T551_00094 [Pneumocystis jirovecii RU7]KTW32609.1 hypothetical protein T551_00094 [Pneumocystis jirovecii RU7]CCJ30683.1 unnamed protein product [Pneumocystis jirovecii]
MGKVQSKSNGDVVFQNESQFPLQFSSALVNHLDSKTDSDTVRAASLEEHIQERVAVEIERLHAKERDILIEVEKELARKNAQYEKAQEKLNSFELKDEISSLEKSIEGMFQIKKLDDTLLEKKKEVIQCLKQNEQKPLNCDEVAKAFRDEVYKLQNAYTRKY